MQDVLEEAKALIYFAAAEFLLNEDEKSAPAAYTGLMKITMSALLVVALGGAVGAVCRYLVTVAMSRQFGDGFPWGTLTVNVAGALLIGVLVAMLDRSMLSEQQRLLLMVGFLGALTTFSSFSLDAYNLYKNGKMSAAALYVLASNALALAAVFGGVWLGRSLGGEGGAA